ncbi:MAG: iron ABC transporter substrate-binding protein [Candidatus Epulonipiscioides saccharophilum]|nr:MAG: iron ABC transporter substrate-binding protein [Epulopiscium sp. AS2M-Bin001]
MSKILKTALFSLLLIISLGACSEGVAIEKPDSDTTELSNGDGYYPVTITNYDYAGNEIELTFEQAPQRVLALYQTPMEIMAALGLGDHVLTCYGLDNALKPEWQEDFQKMNYDASVFLPNLETVLGLAPDFIFSWGSNFSDKKLKDIHFWAERGVNTYMNANTRSGGHDDILEEEYQDILNIGKIFNVNEKAEKLVQEMKDEIEYILEATAELPKQDVMLIEFYEGAIVNYGAEDLGGDMILSLGGNLVNSEHGNISKEDILDVNPDVLFICYLPLWEFDDEIEAKQTTLNNILLDPALASLDAVKNNRVHTIMLGDMYTSGPRTLDGIKIFAEGIYPGLSD